MEIIIKTRSEKSLEENDYRNYLEIEVNGVIKFSVGDGEPEDSNLSRDFSDCFNIKNLMFQAYEAGKNGEQINFLYQDLEY